MRDRYRYPVEQPKSNEPLFKIPKAVVLECERGASEHPVRINKIDAMILEVLEPLSLVPFEPHLRSVYTDRPGRNRVSCCPITPQFSGGALLCEARRERKMKWSARGVAAMPLDGPLQLLVRRRHSEGPRRSRCHCYLSLCWPLPQHDADPGFV